MWRRTGSCLFRYRVINTRAVGSEPSMSSILTYDVANTDQGYIIPFMERQRGEGEVSNTRYHLCLPVALPARHLLHNTHTHAELVCIAWQEDISVPVSNKQAAYSERICELRWLEAPCGAHDYEHHNSKCYQPLLNRSLDLNCGLLLSLLWIV